MHLGERFDEPNSHRQGRFLGKLLLRGRVLLGADFSHRRFVFAPNAAHLGDIAQIAELIQPVIEPLQVAGAFDFRPQGFQFLDKRILLHDFAPKAACRAECCRDR